MRKLIIVPVLMAASAGLAACGYTAEERAATGAIGGAVLGQALGGNTGSTVAGAVVGGVAGAATTPRN
jgi:osmotically inducible lipoprotein OsmB